MMSLSAIAAMLHEVDLTRLFLADVLLVHFSC